MEGDFLRVEPLEEDLKMVSQLAKSDVEGKEDYARIWCGCKCNIQFQIGHDLVAEKGLFRSS